MLPSAVSGLALIGRGVSLLPDGRVYMAGGTQYGAPNIYTDFAQIYDATLDSYTPTAVLPTGRYNAEAQTLPSGDVLIFGGFDGSSYLSDARIYDVSGDSMGAANAMPFVTQSHTSVALNDGRVVSFGGSDSGGFLAKVARYDEGTGNWTQLSDMPFQSQYMAAALMTDGKVLLVGGIDGGGYRDEAYIYDPDLNSYTQVASAPIAMRGGFLERLNNGRFVYGSGEIGVNTYSERAYYYDPATDTWLTGEKLPYRTGFADSVKIDNGDVLVFGGNTADGSAQRSTGLVRYAD